MIRKYIIVAEDSIKGFNEEIARLEREWGAEEIEPCEDAVSKEAVITKIEDEDRLSLMGAFCCHDCAMGFKEKIKELPSVTPKYTDEEIQKMQELEQAQLEKAYELGKAESFEDWLSSFNTESATACFTAVQELKKKLEGDANVDNN